MVGSLVLFLREIQENEVSQLPSKQEIYMKNLSPSNNNVASTWLVHRQPEVTVYSFLITNEGTLLIICPHTFLPSGIWNIYEINNK